MQPDDLHLHLRDGDILKAVVASTARVFRRAVVMPNLKPPITSVKQAIKYRERILSAIPDRINFTPLMMLYLTDHLSKEVIETGYKEGVFFGAKLYPANSTTNSSDGVTDIRKIDSLLETMQSIGMPLLIHGEVTDLDVDVFDREAYFIERTLIPLLSRYPSLKVVLEHITTKEAVEFVENNKGKLGATITPHHLHINRNSMFDGGIRSDFYCLPIAKREKHRIALRKAATSGEPCFFLGTDSAPHLRNFKENSCGCAGIFNAAFALESYLEVFDQENALDKFESFSSIFGAKFYGLPLNSERITIVKSPQLIPNFLEVKQNDKIIERIVHFHAGKILEWSVVSSYSIVQSKL